jgi:hypothetical protein
MNRFWKVSPWSTRLILAFPTLLFLRIGIQNVSDVTTALGVRGIAFTSGMGMTVARVGFGGFPLALGLFLIGCLFFERRLLTALSLVAAVDVVILIVRVAGMFADSSVAENMPLVGTEVVLLFLTAAGFLIEFLRKRRVGVSPFSAIGVAK